MLSLRKFAAANANRVGPGLFLFICIMAFGLFIPFLGFYWDDWPTIFYTFNNRVGQLINHFSYDRPFSVWTYWLVGRLGTAPWIWQVASLLLYWASAVAAAWALKPLWKDHAKKILYIGLLFAIYPGYYVQSSSVIFIPHVAALVLYLVSLGAMGRAVTEKGRWRPYTILALATAAIHMFTVEYFVGLELLRPVYLWILLANQARRKRPELQEILKIWAPYLTVFAAWLIWRLFLLKLPAEPYPLVLLSELRADPLAAVSELLLTMLNDMQYTFFQAWTELIQPMFASLSTGFGLIDVAISLAAGGLVFVVLWAMPWARPRGRARAGAGPDDGKFARQGIALGLAAFLLGMFPVWAIGETISQGDYNLRYILVGMLGASLVVGSLLVLFVPRRPQRILLVSLLVAFALGSHIHAANEYRLDWQAQRNFYWQLSWRAPALQPNTALVSFDRVSTYLGDPMTGNALNVLYPTAGKELSVGLWNFELTRTQTVNRIQNGEPLESDYRGLTFSTGSPEDLVFYFLPEGGCLWLLSPLDVHNDYLPVENRELVAHSNPGNALAVPEGDGYPPAHIFGAEPQHSWCYYYEKADLARWQGDWAQVLDLMAAAEQQGLRPNYGIEWLPLVEAQAFTGDWPLAVETSQRIHAMHARNEGLLCAVWQSIANNAADAAAGQEAYAQVSAFANCDSQ
ncbi:MAG: hypothetical protein WD751_09675 [Anaerolineales bacterium]